MEMKGPNEKECLVHSRDNQGRKMSPACSPEPGLLNSVRFRGIAPRDRGGAGAASAYANSRAPSSFLPSQGARFN